MKHNQSKVIDLSQDAIIHLLTPEDQWTNRQIWHAEDVNIAGRIEIELSRDCWNPGDKLSSTTKRNLASLMKRGIVEYHEYQGYCLTESYLTAHGFYVLGGKLRALDSLRKQFADKLRHELHDLYRWNRLMFLSHDCKVNRHWNNSDDFDWIEFGGTYTDIDCIEGSSNNRHVEFGLIAKHPTQEIDDIARWQETALQAIEIEIARVEYQQDLCNRRAYYARLGA